MMSLNDNEKDFQKKLQEETEIPVIVHERVNQAYRLIENNTAVQKKVPKGSLSLDEDRRKNCRGDGSSACSWICTLCGESCHGQKSSGVWRTFEMLQDNVSFFGDFADHATTLEAVDTTETEGTAADTGSDTEGNPSEDTEAGQDTKKR